MDVVQGPPGHSAQEISNISYNYKKNATILLQYYLANNHHNLPEPRNPQPATRNTSAVASAKAEPRTPHLATRNPNPASQFHPPPMLLV